MTTDRGRGPLLRFAAPLLLPLIVVGPVLILTVRYQFDGLYGQDPYAYLGYALGPLRDSLLALEAPPPFFWPPGYPLVVALLSLAFRAGPGLGQAVSLASGALVPVFTALLAAELWSTKEDAKFDAFVPSLAGLLAAFVGQLWQSSAVIMADTLALASATLGMWALARYGRKGRTRWLCFAAAAVGFAVFTRWAYALVAIPATAYALYVLWRSPRRQALVDAAAAAIVVSIVLSPILHRAFVTDGGSFTGNLSVWSWNPLNAFRREFVTLDGLLSYQYPNGLFYASAPARDEFFTPLLAWLLLPGAWALWRRPSPARLILLGGWIAIILVFHVGGPYQGFRFTLAFLPPLAILAAIGIATVGGWLPSRARSLFALLIVVGVAAMAVGGWQLTASYMERKQADLKTVRWVEARLPPGSTLLTFEITLTFEQYSDLEIEDIFFHTPESIASLLTDERPTYLFVDVTDLENQWRGHAPYTVYRHLADGPGLETIDRRGSYTLFAVTLPP